MAEPEQLAPTTTNEEVSHDTASDAAPATTLSKAAKKKQRKKAAAAAAAGGAAAGEQAPAPTTQPSGAQAGEQVSTASEADGAGETKPDGTDTAAAAAAAKKKKNKKKKKPAGAAGAGAAAGGAGRIINNAPEGAISFEQTIRLLGNWRVSTYSTLECSTNPRSNRTEWDGANVVLHHGVVCSLDPRQTEPVPTIPVAEQFPAHDYPEGEIMFYLNEYVGPQPHVLGTNTLPL